MPKLLALCFCVITLKVEDNFQQVDITEVIFCAPVVISLLVTL